jgi:hypothetical protein
MFQVEHRGEKTREGAKSVGGLLERMKRNGIKDRDNKSSGIEILIVEVFVKVNSTDPLM